MKRDITLKHVSAPVTEFSALLETITRVAADPKSDIEKMRGLLLLRKELQQEQAERDFNAALMQAQCEMEPIRADALNTQTRSRYATYAALDRGARAIYTRHGFALTFNTVPGKTDTMLTIQCDVIHGAGFSRRYEIDMPADGKGAKGGDVMTRTHATSSAVSYGRRNLLCMIFNLAIDKDDDGNKAARQTLSAEQVSELMELVDASGADVDRFCSYMSHVSKVDIAAINDIPADQFKRAKVELEVKAKQKLAALSRMANAAGEPQQ